MLKILIKVEFCTIYISQCTLMYQFHKTICQKEHLFSIIVVATALSDIAITTPLDIITFTYNEVTVPAMQSRQGFLSF